MLRLFIGTLAAFACAAYSPGFTHRIHATPEAPTIPLRSFRRRGLKRYRFAGETAPGSAFVTKGNRAQRRRQLIGMQCVTFGH